MAKKLGGGKWAQITAALAGVPFCLGGGALMQYISFDYVCWVLAAYGMVQLLTSEEERWWVLVGLAVGLGLLSKYTIGLVAAGILVGLFATDARRYFKSKWLWTGASLAFLIFLPNLVWEWRHDFVSLEFLRFIHERDVRTGVTNGFFLGQLELTMLALPLAVAGLWFYYAQPRYRVLAWMYVVALALLVLLHGRDYYLAPAYPVLYAAGAVWLEARIGERKVQIETWSGLVRKGVWVALMLSVVVAAAVALPIAPVNSAWWRIASQRDIVFPEEIGWQEFTQSVAQVWQGLPQQEKGEAGILAGNYGELGALNLYGQEFGLPRAISGVNSSWERGYGDPPPETLIVVGYSRAFLQEHFASCEVKARVWNKYGIANEETTEDPEIFTCRGLRGSWPEFWMAARRFA
jgi:hypothetical protein